MDPVNEGRALGGLTWSLVFVCSSVVTPVLRSLDRCVVLLHPDRQGLLTFVLT